MSYTICYKPRNSDRVGGIFITADGTRCMIPDKYLKSAKLQNDSTLLRLSYSAFVVDISGYCLGDIFNDVINGKLGTVIVPNPADDKPDSDIYATNVTSIVYINMSPAAAADLESNDA